MRIAVIDGGIDPNNPYVGQIAGGVSFAGTGWDDVIGHGTVVAATIREIAVEAEIYSVRIFHRELRADVSCMLQALEWCTENHIDIANFSIGTQNPAHELVLREAVDAAMSKGVTIVAAEGYLPGGIPGVVTVSGSEVARAMPGMPYARNLQGVSFAVARASARLAIGR